MGKAHDSGPNSRSKSKRFLELSGQHSNKSRKVTIFNDKTKANRITKKHHRIHSTRNLSVMQMKAMIEKEENSEDFETIGVELIDPNDNELVEMHLRDSLIKSFMVIFTNEKSQHLLLNRDLIDIAFNCLEFCQDCTLEAKKHVARLISIIFKFP